VYSAALGTHLPGGAVPGQVVVEPDLLNAPEAVLRAVAAGAGISAVILGVDDSQGVAGIEARPLDPSLSSTRKSSGAGPTRRQPPRPPGGAAGQGFRTTFSQPSSLFLKMS
jgi:hypothetical protein